MSRRSEKEWPVTVEQAVARILRKMSPADKARVCHTPWKELYMFHHTWGAGIRNSYGLWGGNVALLADSGCFHPDDCSMKIIRRVWKELQADEQPPNQPNDVPGKA